MTESTRMKEIKHQIDDLQKEYSTLQKEIETFKAGWYLGWKHTDDPTYGGACFFLINTPECYSHLEETFPHLEPFTLGLAQKFLQKKPIYDWSKIPSWATIAVITGEDGVWSRHVL